MKISIKSLYTILLLVMSNTFMTFAWHDHLKFKELKWFAALPLVVVVLISWGVALFEYFLGAGESYWFQGKRGALFSGRIESNSGSNYFGGFYGFYFVVF